MLDFIRADRTGDAQLHISTFKKALPIFHIMDRVNYTRWGPIYLNDLLKMKDTAPDAFNEIMNGRLTVKQTNASFTSVNADQALEQTINKTSKSIAGIGGNVKNIESITAWELTYHEFLGISEFIEELTFVDDSGDQLMVHHEDSKMYTLKSEQPVEEILSFLEERKIDPFVLEPNPLKNIVTNELVHPETAEKILNIFDIALSVNKEFIDERYIKKEKTINDTITQNNFPSFKTVPKIQKSKDVIAKETHEKHIHRFIALASERKFPIEKLLTYDLISKNPLFDKDGLISKQNDKSSLVRELEDIAQVGQLFASSDDIDFSYDEVETCLVIDVMLMLRAIRWTKLNTFQDLAESFCK